jgi:hypothetical protein
MTKIVKIIERNIVVRKSEMNIKKRFWKTLWKQALMGYSQGAGIA